MKESSTFINPNKGDVREALPGAGGGGGGKGFPPPSFSALEPPKGQKSCFHITWDNFSTDLSLFLESFLQIIKNAKIENILKIAKK